MSKYDQRSVLIKACARELFIEKGIEQTTFVDIAKRAKVGEATVYRHFVNKLNLATEIAIDYANQYAAYFIEPGKWLGLNHYQRFEVLLNHYIDLYEEQPDYFIFLEHFDNFTSRHGKSERFEVYESAFARVFNWFYNEETSEILDYTFDQDLDLIRMAYTFNISFLSLCQKQLLRGHVLTSDDRFVGIENLVMMKSVMMETLKIALNKLGILNEEAEG